MYLPDHFRETRPDVLRSFVELHPLATLIASTADGLSANHVPLMWHQAQDATQVLRGHVARGNSLWRQKENNVLAVFSGAQHYVSPSWYPSKHEDGKVVPTWNYAAVHIYGEIRFIDDVVWLRAFIESLTDAHERDNPQRWHVSDAPTSYVNALLNAIVGIEITIKSVEGKFKSSQNRSQADRDGVAAALAAAGQTSADIAELVRSPPT